MDTGILTADITIAPHKTFTEADVHNDATLEDEDSTIIKDVEGRQLLLLRTTRDESGDMVATQKLKAAKVTARFRNVAEREGRVIVEFVITVPAELIRPEWQIRYHPYLITGDRKQQLDSVLITGETYRREQLKGYNLYQRFLDRIKTDSLDFIHQRELKIFLERYLTTFDIDENEALDHYLDRLAMYLNSKRIGARDKKFRKFIKSPFAGSGVKLDTTLAANGEEFTYLYAHEFPARESLRKASIYVDGQIWQWQGLVADISPSAPLDFYISSIAYFIEELHQEDSRYQEGLQAIRDRRWREAVEHLRAYGDFNTAVAFCGAGFNWSALELLQRLEDNAKVNYLLALCHSREGHLSQAVAYYLRSCRQDPRMIHRGNLDPEIHILIDQFNLNNNL